MVLVTWPQVRTALKTIWLRPGCNWSTVLRLLKAYVKPIGEPLLVRLKPFWLGIFWIVAESGKALLVTTSGELLELLFQLPNTLIVGAWQSSKVYVKVSTSDPQSLVAVMVRVLMPASSCALSSSALLVNVKAVCSIPLKMTLMLLRLFTFKTVARRRKAALLSVLLMAGLVTAIEGGVQFWKLIELLIWSLPHGLV